MSRFEGDLRLIGAIIDGVEEMHRAHATRGRYDTHDLINWLNAHRNAELNDIIAHYTTGDVVNAVTVQIGNSLKNRLGQRKLGDRRSSRDDLHLVTGVRAGGDCEVSVWEISPETRDGLDRARSELLDEGEGRDHPDPTAPVDLGWIGRIAGTFKDDPVFAEVVELGRARRIADRPDEP